MDIRPIRNEKDYEATLTRIEEIWDAEPGTRESDELEVLSVLVEAYGETRYPIDPPDPVEAIKFRMEQTGLRRKDLQPLIGHRGRVSEVCNRKRPLTLHMIRNLSEGLGISADVLVAEYPLRAKKTVRETSR